MRGWRSCQRAQHASSDGGIKELPAATTCPRVVVSKPQKDAYAQISTIIGVDLLGGSTPTDKALNVVVSHLDGMAGQVLDARVYPTIVVLATDGEPNDFCSFGTGAGPRGPDVRPLVISAVSLHCSGPCQTTRRRLSTGASTAVNHRALATALEAASFGEPLVDMAA